MIDEWKRDRSDLDRQMNEIRNYLERHPNRDKYQPARAKFRVLLNQLALARMAVHRKIRAYEEEERLTEIFKEMSGLTDVEVANLMKQMERFKAVEV